MKPKLLPLLTLLLLAGLFVSSMVTKNAIANPVNKCIAGEPCNLHGGNAVKEEKQKENSFALTPGSYMFYY